MASELEELDLLIEYRTKLAAFLEAKENQADDPDGYQAAKAEFSAHRTYWRGIRDWQRELARAGDPVALAKLIADVGPGGAMASPVTVAVKARSKAKG